MRQVNIAGTQHVSASRKSGLDNRVVIRIGEDDSLDSDRFHDLCRGSQEVYVFLNFLVGEAPTGAYAPVGEYPGNFVKNEGGKSQPRMDADEQGRTCSIASSIKASISCSGMWRARDARLSRF